MYFRHSIVSLVSILFALIFMPRAHADVDPFEQPIVQLGKVRPDNVVRIKAVSFDVMPGSNQVRRATLSLETRAGFKLYSKGLRIEHHTQLEPFPVPVEFVANPPETIVDDEWYKEKRGVFFSGTIFTITTRDNITPEDSISVRFEACSVSSCLLPTTFVISPTVSGSVARFERQQQGDGPVNLQGAEFDSSPNFTSTAIASPTAAAVPDMKTESQNKVIGANGVILNNEKVETGSEEGESLSERVSLWVARELKERGILLFPALFLAGLLMNATPCVYPVIPITINVLSRFGNSETDEKKKKRNKKIYPLIYVLGMVLAYSTVGVVAAMSGGIFGALLQNTAVTVAVAILMFLMGLWMLGVFSATAIQNFAYRLPISQKHPAWGVLTMGAVSGLVSAPCTGPVLSALLLLIGQTHNAVQGFMLMLFFSLGFGAPYVVLGMASQNMVKLPKVGGLLEWTKFVFAALMFALAIYYLRPVLGRLGYDLPFLLKPHGMDVVVALLVVVICYLVSKHQKTIRAKVAKIGAVLVLTQLALWLTLFVTSGFVREAPALSSVSLSKATPQNEIPWVKDWNTAIQLARSEHKPLVADLWAEWCAACLHMDEDLWQNPDVVRYVRTHFVAVKVDFTTPTDTSNTLQSAWDLTGLPAVGFFSAGADFEKAPELLYREAILPKTFFEGVKKLGMNP